MDEVRAQLNYLGIAPRKVRLVTAVVKGMPAHRALQELEHRIKRAARPLQKLLRSAIADAQHNFQVGPERLYVKELRVDPGPVRKRYEPRAFGRAAPIRKRTSHVRLVLGVRGEVLADVRKRRKTTLAPRTVSPQEAQEQESPRAAGQRPRGEVGRPSAQAKKKSADFVRRVFQRKAI